MADATCPREDAEWMRDDLIERGFHPKILKVREWTAELPECATKGTCKRCTKSHRGDGK